MCVSVRPVKGGVCYLTLWVCYLTLRDFLKVWRYIIQFWLIITPHPNMDCVVLECWYLNAIIWHNIRNLDNRVRSHFMMAGPMTVILVNSGSFIAINPHKMYQRFFFHYGTHNMTITSWFHASTMDNNRITKWLLECPSQVQCGM